MSLVDHVISTSTSLAQENVQIEAGVKTLKMAMDSQSSAVGQLIESGTEIMKDLGVGNTVDISA